MKKFSQNYYQKYQIKKAKEQDFSSLPDTNTNEIILSFISEAAVKKANSNGFDDYSTREKNFFNSHPNFRGQLAQQLTIYSSDGKIEKIYLGDGDNNFQAALAHAALKVPPGSYRLENYKYFISANSYLGWALAQYRFEKYRKDKVEPAVLLVPEEVYQELINSTEAIFLTRDLINMPTNELNPESFATIVAEMAQNYQGEFKEWVDEELLTANFPAIQAVGRASINKPRLLELNCGPKSAPRISIIGKGVCFDSGGLNLKPTPAIRLMKKDMGGAAHAIALAQLILEEKIPVNLQLLIPAVENSIGPDSYRPGDVLRMRNNLTVEIDNTDAEGRLILADALSYAAEQKPELIIDFSTLTGAARVAVGTEIAAFFCNQKNIAQELIELSESLHDPLWQLPLFSGYESMLKSSIADLSNCSDSPYAGAITAALFLQHFLPKEIPWIHFDIMAWNLSSKAGKPEGGEAMGLQTVAAFLKKKYLKKY